MKLVEGTRYIGRVDRPSSHPSVRREAHSGVVDTDLTSAVQIITPLDDIFYKISLLKISHFLNIYLGCKLPSRFLREGCKT